MNVTKILVAKLVAAFMPLIGGGHYPAPQPLVDAIVIVSNEQPLFSGETGPGETAALLVSIAGHEGSFQLHRPERCVASGRGELCDDRKYACSAFQIHKMDGSKWSDAECTAFEKDYTVPTRLAREHLRTSLEKCKANPWQDRAALYASGRCDAGLDKSRERMNHAKKIWAEVGQ